MCRFFAVKRSAWIKVIVFRFKNPFLNDRGNSGGFFGIEIYKPNSTEALLADPGDPATWASVVMRLTNGTHEVTHYDFEHYYTYEKGSSYLPEYWDLEGSVDGVTWDMLDKHHHLDTTLLEDAPTQSDSWICNESKFANDGNTYDKRNTNTVNKAGNIRFGLAALKGVGNSAANSIVEERNANGPYKDIFDFVTRVDLRSCNKKCIETLAYGGAFDCFTDMHRAQFFYSEKEGQTFIDKLVSFANKSQNSDASQFSIFDMNEAVEENVNLPLPDCEPWGNYEQIKNEKEVAGFYISGHPLDEYKPIIRNFASVDLTQISDMDYMKKNHISGKPFTFVAIVTDCVSKLSRKNTEYGTITFEDYESSWQWTLFSEEYTKYKHLFEKGKRLYVRAFLKRQQWRDKVTGEDVERFDIKPMEIHYLEDAYEKLCQQVTLVLGIDDVTLEVAEKLKIQLQKYKGKVPFYVRIFEHGGVFFSDFFNFSTKVNPEEFVNKLELPINFKVELK